MRRVDGVQQLFDGGTDLRLHLRNASRREGSRGRRAETGCAPGVEANHRGGGRCPPASRISAASGAELHERAAAPAPAEIRLMVEEDRFNVVVARDDVVVDRRRVEHRPSRAASPGPRTDQQVTPARAGRSRRGPGSPAARRWPCDHDDARRGPVQYGRHGMSADPPFTDEHEALRESIRRFVANELRPHAATWEEERWFPDDVFAKLARVGFLGLKYPEPYGGQRGDPLHDAVLARSRRAAARAGWGGPGWAHVAIATPPVWKFGNDDQKQALPRARHSRREDRRARHHRARRRQRRGVARHAHRRARDGDSTSSTARRRTSPTACAATSWCSR